MEGDVGAEKSEVFKKALVLEDNFYTYYVQYFEKFTYGKKKWNIRIKPNVSVSLARFLAQIKMKPPYLLINSVPVVRD